MWSSIPCLTTVENVFITSYVHSVSQQYFFLKMNKLLFWFYPNSCAFQCESFSQNLITSLSTEKNKSLSFEMGGQISFSLPQDEKKNQPPLVVLLLINIPLCRISCKRFVLELNLKKNCTYSKNYETDYSSFLFPFFITIRKLSMDCKGSFRRWFLNFPCL